MWASKIFDPSTAVPLHLSLYSHFVSLFIAPCTLTAPDRPACTDKREGSDITQEWEHKKWMCDKQLI